jgi:hypothetical protein
MKYYIYEIKIGPHKYIGSTKSADYRFKQHQDCALNLVGRKANILLYVKMREYGVNNCEYQILEECYVVDKRSAEMIEQTEIDKLSILERIQRDAYESRQQKLEEARIASAANYKMNAEKVKKVSNDRYATKKKQILLQRKKRRDDPIEREKINRLQRESYARRKNIK